MRQVEHYLLYEKRQNGILHENYYGRDQKGNRDVYVKIFETKKVPDLQPIRRHINNEIMIQQQVSATNQSKQTLQLVDNYLTQNSIYLIYLNHSFRTLKSFIQYKNMLTERQATDYFAQIYSAYSEIAKINAIPRDMTMENLLIDDDENIKIDDFGIFKFLYLQKNSSVKSRINEGPETYSDRSNYTKEKSDSWSIGVVLFQLLFQKDPQFKSGELIVPIDRSVSPAMVDLLKQLLAEQPSRRLSWSNIFSHACMINFYNLETQQEDWGMSLSAFIRPSNQHITEKYPKLQTAAAKASASSSSDSKPTNYTQLARAFTLNSNSNNSSEKKEYPKLAVTQQQAQQQQLQQQTQSQLKYPSLPVVVEHMMPPGSAIYHGTCLQSNYEKYLFDASNTILSQSTFSDKSNKASSVGQAGSLSNNSNQFMNNQSMKQTPFNPFANVSVQQQQQQQQNSQQMQQQQQLQQQQQQQQQQQLQQQKLREQQELKQQQYLQQQQQQKKKEEEEELLKQQKLLFQQQVAQQNMMREAAEKAKKEQEILIAKQQQLENEQKIQQQQQQYYQQQQQAKLLAQQQQQQLLQQQQQQQMQQQQQQLLMQQQQQQLLQQQQQQLLQQQQQQLQLQQQQQQQQNFSQGNTNLNQNQQSNQLENQDNYEDDYEIIEQEQNASSTSSFQLQSQFMIQKRKKQDRFNKIIGKNKQKSSSQQNQQQQQEQLDKQVDDEIVKIEQQLLQETNKQSQQQQTGQQQQQQQQSYPTMNNVPNQVKKVETNNAKNIPQPNGFNPFSGSAMGVSLIRGGQQKEQQQPDESAKAISNKKIFDKNVKYLQSELDKFNVMAQAVETAEELLDAKNNFWVVVSYLMLKRLWLVRCQLADSLENHEKIDEEFEEWELFCISSEFQRALDKLHNSNKAIKVSALGLQKLTQKRIQRLNPQVSKELVQHLPLEETSNFAANFFVHIHFHILSLLESVPNQPPPAKIALLKHIAQLKDILLIVEQGIFNNSDVFFNLQKHNAIQATSSEEAINEYINNKNKSLQIFTAYYKSLGYEI